MSENLFTYAVARIRTKEMSLLNQQAIEQLLGAKSYDECLRLLLDRGWGSSDSNPSAEAMLSAEREKTWALMSEMVEDMGVFDVFLYINDYHNLKAAIKMVCTDSEDFGLFLSRGTVELQKIIDAARTRDWSELPEAMRAPAQEAYEILSQTHDGQLCDVVIDRAALDAIYASGKAADSALLARYAELTVVCADIKTAVRCQQMGKPLDFIRRALAPCDSLNVEMLAKAATESIQAILDYLSITDYVAAIDALRDSPSAFERWCDNLIIRDIRPQQFEVFGIGPLAAYILGRENEIKTVRIILSGKLNELPEQAIRERVREMYV